MFDLGQQSRPGHYAQVLKYKDAHAMVHGLPPKTEELPNLMILDQIYSISESTSGWIVIST